MDSVSVTARSTSCSPISELVGEVQHGRLGEAADDLVGARDHEVGAGREGVLGQLLVEGEVGAPGLVHDQRDAVLVGDLRQRTDVRHGPEVGRGDDQRAGGVGRQRRALRAASRGARQWAMPSSASSSGAAKVGRIPERTSASIVLEWALRWTITFVAAVGEREARREVALRGAVDQEPRSPGPPRLGRERLCRGEGGRLRRRGRRRRSGPGCRAPAPARRAPRAAPRRRPDRPCGRARAGGPGRARRRRSGHRGRASGRGAGRGRSTPPTYRAAAGWSAAGARRCSAYIRIACAPAGCSRALSTSRAVLAGSSSGCGSSTP